MSYLLIYLAHLFFDVFVFLMMGLHLLCIKTRIHYPLCSDMSSYLLHSWFAPPAGWCLWGGQGSGGCGVFRPWCLCPIGCCRKVAVKGCVWITLWIVGMWWWMIGGKVQRKQHSGIHISKWRSRHVEVGGLEGRTSILPLELEPSQWPPGFGWHSVKFLFV